MIANFADTVFAVGRDAMRPDYRYIKLIKSRNAPSDYNAANVLTCRLQKSSPPYEGGVDAASADGVVLSSAPAKKTERKPANFLGFIFERLSDEYEHLSRPFDNSNNDRQRLILEVARLSNAGLSQRMIARRLNISPTTVKSYLESKTKTS